MTPKPPVALETQETEIASSEPLRLALDIAGIGIWEWDMVSNQVVWNSRQFELFGVPEVEGTIPLETANDVIHPDDREQLSKTAKLVFEGGVPALEEFRVVHPDGSVRWLLRCSDVVRSNGSQSSAMLVGVNIDITKSKETEIALRRSEQNLKEANAALESRITVGTEELKAEAERHKRTQSALNFSRRMESIGQLTGGIAHDFNNLMTVILGNSELLELEFESTEEASMNFVAIKDAIARGASLTERLLAYAGKTAQRPIAEDIAGLIKNMKGLLLQTLRAPIALQIKMPSDLWHGMIDSHQFEDALLNLVINARDAMPQGGYLTIEAINTSIAGGEAHELGELVHGDYVKISVIDTGSGISSENLKRVVDPFFTTKEVGKGSGLGLSMVYGFTRQSKGHFSIDSEVGTGTTVVLYLPKAIKVEFEDPNMNPVRQKRGSFERILVVEDDPEILKICVSVLRKQGFDVIEAIDGKQAMKHFEDGQKIDVLFTDIILPGGMNGGEIAEKAKAVQSDIKVVYTTGFADISSIENLTLDPDAIRINKPYAKEELLAAINSALPNRSE